MFKFKIRWAHGVTENTLFPTLDEAADAVRTVIRNAYVYDEESIETTDAIPFWGSVADSVDDDDGVRVKGWIVPKWREEP